MKYEVLKWLASLEKARGLGPKGNSSICEENGGVYASVMWCIDIHRLAKPIQSELSKQANPAILFQTDDEAWNAWRAAFESYLEERKGKIYWRIFPKLEQTNDGRFTVRARVLVAASLDSDKLLDKDMALNLGMDEVFVTTDGTFKRVQ